MLRTQFPSPIAALRLLLPLLVLAGVSAMAAEPAGTPGAFDLRAFLAPFHTVTLHLPIGFVMIAAILEAFHFFRPSPPLRQAIGLILLFSAGTAVLVTLLGIFRAEGGGYEPATLEHHRRYGIAVAALTLVLAVTHPFIFREGRGRASGWVFRTLLLGDLVLLTIAGHGGGNLTHGSKYLTENAPDWVKGWIEESGDGTDSGGTAGAAGEFATEIRPVLEAKCFSCHGEEKQKGDYRMDTAEGLFAAGESGLDPIVAGDPLSSYLVETITLPAEDDAAMPPEGKDRLSAEETLAVIRWIWKGADTGAP